MDKTDLLNCDNIKTEAFYLTLGVRLKGKRTTKVDKNMLYTKVYKADESEAEFSDSVDLVSSERTNSRAEGFCVSDAHFFGFFTGTRSSRKPGYLECVYFYLPADQSFRCLP